MTVGQWYAVFVRAGGRKPLDWSDVFRRRDERRRKKGLPPIGGG